VPKPFVTVLIDTYNQEAFIEEAIASVLQQDFPASEREILVVDDGSTDRTAEIARALLTTDANVQKRIERARPSAMNASRSAALRSRQRLRACASCTLSRLKYSSQYSRSSASGVGQ